MAIAQSLKIYLEKKHLVYTVHELPRFASLPQAAASAQISPASLAKSVVVKDDLGLILVVMPATHGLDIDALSKLLRRRLEMASEEALNATFKECQEKFIPPLGEIYGVRSIIDENLLGPESIYFPGGDATHLINLSNRDFSALLQASWLARGFTRIIDNAPEGAAEHWSKTAAGIDLRSRIEKIKSLPPMPDMAQRIFSLKTDPYADAEKLARAIELDPSLAAQVMRYARSPFFHYQGKIDSVRTAISRVLGFDMVMSLALGLAVAKPFKMPVMGPLGLNSFWRHATYSAALAQALSKELPSRERPPAGLCYLAGLLHNFGHLLLGHLFKHEFCVLSNLLDENPTAPISELEKRILGVDHGELGAWLMKSWNLPEEIIVAVRHHHDESYDGPHAVYARLALITDRMLKSHNIGDAESHEIPAELLADMGLNEIQTIMVMNRILEGCEGLNTMAQQLAA